MKIIDKSNIRHLVTFHMRVNRNRIAIWSLVMFAIMFLYMILFGSMQDIAQMKYESMPKEMLQFFGMEDMGAMANYVQYFAMIYNLCLIAISIFAASFASSIVSKEEDDKTMEVLAALTISRQEIFISHLLTSFIATLAVVCSCVVAALVCGFIVGGDSFVLSEFIPLVKIAGSIPFIFMCIGMFSTSFSSSTRFASLGVASVAVCYMLGFLAKIMGEKLNALLYLSPFEQFNAHTILQDPQHLTAVAVVYAVVSIALIFIAYRQYAKRDMR